VGPQAFLQSWSVEHEWHGPPPPPLLLLPLPLLLSPLLLALASPPPLLLGGALASPWLMVGVSVPLHARSGPVTSKDPTSIRRAMIRIETPSMNVDDVLVSLQCAAKRD
jgi:hypothetical protein